MIEEFGRKLEPVSAEAKCIAQQKMPADTFDVDPQRSSMDKQSLEAITTTKPSWPTLSPEAFMCSGMRWMCAMRCKGDLGEDSSYLEVLLAPAW